MENLDLTNETVIIKEPTINFMTGPLREFLFSLKLKIILFLKHILTPRSLRNNYKSPINLQPQNYSINKTASININGNNYKFDCTTFNDCLKNMPSVQREAFKLKTFGNNTTAFICLKLNINEAVFWSLIHKSRKELIETLDIQ